MRYLGRFTLSVFFWLPLTLGWGQGRAPAPAAPNGTRISAQRVFLKTLPAGGDGYYVIWNSSGTAGGSAVSAQRFGLDDGARWPIPGLSLAHDLRDAGVWDTCSDAQGGLITAAGEANRLAVRRINAEGKVLWETAGVSYSSEAPVTTVVVIPDGHGGVYVTWAQESQGSSTVWVQLWDAQGRPQWGPPGLSVALSDIHQVQPNILPDGQGGALVAWKSHQENISRVIGQRISVNGKRLWTDAGVAVEAPAGDLHQRITMVCPSSGTLVIAWTQGVAGVNRLFFQRIEPNGFRSWSGGGITGRPPILEQWNPVLLANNEGSVWIGWEEVQSGGDAKVKLNRRGPPNGDPWPPGEILLAPSDGNQGRLALGLDGAGGALAAWVENRTDVGLYVQHVDGQGRIQYPTGSKVASRLTRPQNPRLVLVAPGRAAVVWLEEKGKSLWDLHHQIIDFH